MVKTVKKKMASKKGAAKNKSAKGKGSTALVKPAKKQGSGALAKLSDIKKFSGQGLEMAKGDTECFAMAFLKILQDLSPEIKKGEAQLAEAEVGDIMNTVTKELFGEADGVYVVPCFFERAMVEWIDINDGGGFVAKHGVKDAIVATAKADDKGRLRLPNGHQLQDTRYHYCLLVKKTGKSWTFTAVIIPMASTQIKASRNWVVMMSELLEDDDDGNKFNPPTFATIYQLTTGFQDNNVGQSWYGWKNTKYIGLVEDDLMLNAAHSLYKLASDGRVQGQTDGLGSEDVVVEGDDIPM